MTPPVTAPHPEPSETVREPGRDDTPKGYREVRSVGNAWTNGREIIVLGTPSDVEDENASEYHNCDAMGCGSLGWHVLYRAALAAVESSRA